MIGALKGKLHVTAILSIVLTLSLIGQTPPFSFKHFSTQEGIFNLSIHAMVKDQYDRLWLGTSNGLYIYNGYETKNFDKNAILSSTLITCLYLDHNKCIWVGTFSSGLFYINPSTKTITHYSYDPNEPTGLSANRIHGILQHHTGKIYIALEKEGFDLFDPDSGIFQNHKISDFLEVNNYNRNNTILSMEVDPVNSDHIWMGTLDGLVKFNSSNNTLELFRCSRSNSNDPESINTRENTIKTIYCEKDRIYMGTWGGGLCVFNKKSNTWSSYKFQTPFPASGMRNDVTQLVPKSEEELWVLAYRQELGIFNKITGVFSFHGYKNIRTIYKDESSNIWFGTLDNGIFAYFPKMQAFEKTEMPFTLTKMVFHPEKPLAYAGIFSESVLLEIDLLNNSHRKIPFEPVFDKEINFIADLQFDKNGSLYLLGQTAVYQFNAESNQVKKLFSPYDLDENKNTITSATSFLIDKKQQLWYATKFNGLYRKNLITNQLIHYKPELNTGYTSWISRLTEDKHGNIWYGSGKGFGFFDQNKQGFTSFENSINNTSPDSLAFISVTTLVEDLAGNMYLGSLKKGLGKFKSISPDDIHTYTVKSAALLNDVILELQLDNNGKLWMITREGVSKYDPKTNNFEHFSDDFGIKNPNSLSVSNDGKLYISSSGGFYKYNPNHQIPSPVLPEIQLEEFKIFNESYLPNGNIDLLDTIKLDHKENYFSVDFGCSEFNHPHLLQFRYKLEGIHDQWIDAGKRRYTSFSNLSGGTYKLLISAGYGDQLFGPNRILMIIVKPPFWQLFSFWLIISLLLLLISWFIVRQRVRSIKKKAALKASFERRISEVKLSALQAQMNPHFLFNCLNSIKLLTLERKVDEASDYLTRFSRLIRSILNSSNQIVIPLKEELKTLQLYIDMESLRFSHEFQSTLTTDPSIDIEQVKIPPMIIQVFVENAIKHGLRPKPDNKMLDIHFRKVSDKLVCTVKDNGIGRKEAEKHQQHKAINRDSIGIKNTMERISQLKQLHGIDVIIEIKDLYDNNIPLGTLVKIAFPLNELYSTDLPSTN